MKKIMKTLTIVIGCAMTMAVLTACSDNTDNPAPKPEQESQAEYTIMFYTAGARHRLHLHHASYWWRHERVGRSAQSAKRGYRTCSR